MSKKPTITRRNFVKTSAGAAIAAAAASATAAGSSSPYDSKGLPTRVLGKTGVRVPYIAFGTGSRFCGVSNEEEAQKILHHALDNGMYYWDTASGYRDKASGVISEERLGRVLKSRRKEVFLASKVRKRDVEGAKAELERSLKRLQTDHLDLCQIHTLGKMEDVDAVSEKGGVVDFMYEMKAQGVVKNIGFSGHASPDALLAMVERHEFDTMLIALNHLGFGQREPQPREQKVIPAAHKKGIGVMVMKVVRPRETVENLDTSNLIRYGLSIPFVTGAVIAQDSIEIVDANVKLMRDFKPLPKADMDRLTVALTPFYQGKGLAWMQPGYEDGQLA